MKRYKSMFKESKIRQDDIAYEAMSGGLTVSYNQDDRANKGSLVVELGHFSGSNTGVSGKYVIDADNYKYLDDNYGMERYNTREVNEKLLPLLKKAADKYEDEITKIMKSFK